MDHLYYVKYFHHWYCTLSSPAGIYLPKVKNRNTRTRCEVCSKLTIKTPERRYWRHSGVFIVNFEYISHLVLALVQMSVTVKKKTA